MASLADQSFLPIYEQDTDFFGVRNSDGSVGVSITRGAFTTSNVPAIVTLLEERVVSQTTGIAVIVKTRGYIVAKDEYLLDSVPVRPQRGDLITETINGVARKFLCLPERSMEAVEEEYPDGVRWMLRTKEVANASIAAASSITTEGGTPITTEGGVAITEEG